MFSSVAFSLDMITLNNLEVHHTCLQRALVYNFINSLMFGIGTHLNTNENHYFIIFRLS